MSTDTVKTAVTIATIDPLTVLKRDGLGNLENIGNPVEKYIVRPGLRPSVIYQPRAPGLAAYPLKFLDPTVKLAHCQDLPVESTTFIFDESCPELENYTHRIFVARHIFLADIIDQPSQEFKFVDLFPDPSQLLHFTFVYTVVGKTTKKIHCVFCLKEYISKTHPEVLEYTFVRSLVAPWTEEILDQISNQFGDEIDYKSECYNTRSVADLEALVCEDSPSFFKCDVCHRWPIHTVKTEPTDCTFCKGTCKDNNEEESAIINWNNVRRSILGIC